MTTGLDSMMRRLNETMSTQSYSSESNLHEQKLLKKLEDKLDLHKNLESEANEKKAFIEDLLKSANQKNEDMKIKLLRKEELKAQLIKLRSNINEHSFYIEPKYRRLYRHVSKCTNEEVFFSSIFSV